MHHHLVRPPRFAAMLLALVGLLVTGCQSNHARPKAHALADRGNLIVKPDQAQAIGYTPSWAFDLGIPDRQHLVHVTRVGDLLIAVERPRNMVSAVSVRDGALQWRAVIGNRQEPLYRPVRAGNRIFINSSSRVYTLNARSGNVKHIGDLKYTVNVGPVLVKDKAIFGSLTGRIFGFDIDANDEDWAYNLTTRVLSTPVATDRGIFAADAQGVYAMLSPTDGSLMWRSRTFGPISAQPAADTRNVYVPSKDRTLYALNLSNGRDAWKYRAISPLSKRPVVLRDTCYLPVPGDGLVALNAPDGKMLWKLDTAPTPIKMQGDNLMTAGPRRIEIRDTQSGDLKAQAQVGSSFRVITGPDQSLIVVTRQGRMLRLNRQP